MVPQRGNTRVRLGGHNTLACHCGGYVAVVIPKGNRLCLWRRRHRVRLGGSTDLASARVEGGAVLRRMEHSLGGGRSDGLPVGIFVVQSLQHLVEFCVVVRMVFHVLCVPRSVYKGQRSLSSGTHNPLRRTI